MILFHDMQTDEMIEPWVKEFEVAFQPFAEFVDAVAEQLEAIELQAILNPPAEVQVVVSADVQSAPIVPAEPIVLAQAPAEKVRKKLDQKRVLLVDDAEINRVLMSHYFKGLPVKLDFASSGEVALRKIKDATFDLIVIDDELQNPSCANIAHSIKESGANALLVALSNQHDILENSIPEFASVLKRGLPRELFVEKLKALLWV